MAVGPFIWTDAGFLHVLKGETQIGTDQVVAVLVRTAYTPAPLTESTYADISGNLDTGGFATTHPNGQDVTMTWADVGTKIFELDIGDTDVVNASATFQGRYLYFVHQANGTTIQSTDYLLGYVDLDGATDATSTDGNFNYTPHANGLYRCTNTD